MNGKNENHRTWDWLKPATGVRQSSHLLGDLPKGNLCGRALTTFRAQQFIVTFKKVYYN